MWIALVELQTESDLYHSLPFFTNHIRSPLTTWLQRSPEPGVAVLEMAVETVETSAMWCRLKRNLKTEIEHLKKSQADSKQYNNYSNYSNIYIIYSIITHNLVCGPNFPSLLILSVGCGWSEFAASNLLSLCHTRSFPWTMADRVNDVNVWKINALGLLLLCAWWRWPIPYVV